MIPLHLTEIAEAVGGVLHGGDRAVRALTTDSRRPLPEALFVALEGPVHNAHDHVGAALAGGAVAYLARRVVVPAEQAPVVVVSDPAAALAELARWVRERVDPQVVAITGSVGKTTTKDLAAAAVAAGRDVAAAPGSYNNELGVPLTCLQITLSTEVLVAEVGSRGRGHIAALMPLLRPDIAIVTAVSGAHLETFGDLATVAAAKAELVEALPATGAAVLNAGDPRVLAMADRTDAAVITYAPPGFEGAAAADVRAADVSLDPLARPRFRALTPWGSAEVRLPLAGEHQVGNALAALAVAGLTGVGMADAADALTDAVVAPWRSEVRRVGDLLILNDAYNANPTSVHGALDALAALEVAGRRWAVLGVMAELGPTSPRAHREVGRRAVTVGVDELVVVGDGAAAVADGALGAGLAPVHVHRVDDATAALELLRTRLAGGDAVLIKASRVGGLEAVAQGLRDSAIGATAAEDAG